MRLRTSHLAIGLLLLAAGLVILYTTSGSRSADPEPVAPQPVDPRTSARPDAALADPAAGERVPHELQGAARSSEKTPPAAAPEVSSTPGLRQRFVFDDGSSTAGLTTDVECLAREGRPLEVRAGGAPATRALDERGELEVAGGSVVGVVVGEHAFALVPIPLEGGEAAPEHTLPALVTETLVVPAFAPARSSALELRITSVDLQSQFHVTDTEKLLPDVSHVLTRAAHVRATRPERVLIAACTRVRLEPYETEVRRTLPRGRYVVEVLDAPPELWVEPYELVVSGARSELKLGSVPTVEIEISPQLEIEPTAVRLEGLWTATDGVTGEEKVIESLSVELKWRRVENLLLVGLHGESKTSKILRYTLVVVAEGGGREHELRSEPRRWHQFPRAFLLDGRLKLLAK